MSIGAAAIGAAVIGALGPLASGVWWKGYGFVSSEHLTLVFLGYKASCLGKSTFPLKAIGHMDL